MLAGGYRLHPEAGALDPALRDELALLAWLHRRVTMVTRPVRGRHAGATRRTYREGLRALARAWARSDGRPVRHGERVLAQLEGHGLVHRVRISQVAAYRLTYATLADSLRALEGATGRRLVDWALGPAEPDGAGEEERCVA